MKQAKQLCTLFKREEISYVHGDTQVYVSGISLDSRTTKPGDLFFALKGKTHDGSAFIREACMRGAAAVVCSEAPAAIPPGIPYLLSDTPRRLLSRCSNRFYGSPSSDMQVIGVTGTNGKSSTCWYLYGLFNALGIHTGIISGYWTGTPGDLEINSTGLSTPEAPMLHHKLASMANQGCRAAVVEVTSHALASLRVEDISFTHAVFTALGRDHLDFHASMENYLETKLHLKDLLKPEGMIVYSSKNAYAHILHALTGRRRVLYRDVSLSREGEAWILTDHEKQANLLIHYSEPFQLENFFLAACTAWDFIGPGETVDLSHITPLPGRGEVIHSNLGWAAVIDYAHNPQGFDAVFNAYPPCAGRQAALFGAAGGRDRGKRREMAAAADQSCDIIILTEEDPCDEDPDRIISDLMQGISRKVPGETLFVIPDRFQALQFAVSLMQRGDRLFLLGKGHEEHIALPGGGKKPWNDREKLAEILASRQ